MHWSWVLASSCEKIKHEKSKTPPEGGVLLTCERHYHSSPNKQGPYLQRPARGGCRQIGSDILEFQRFTALLQRYPREQLTKAFAAGIAQP